MYGIVWYKMITYQIILQEIVSQNLRFFIDKVLIKEFNITAFL